MLENLQASTVQAQDTTPDDKPTENLAELHSFLLNRIYLESQLLYQRMNIFTTTSVFLAAALALTVSQPVIPYVICSAGLVLALSNVAIGLGTELAITFWREYLHRVELRLGIVRDRALFMFYERQEGVDTIVGNLRAAGPNPRLYKQTIPWRWSASRTTNLLTGAWFPFLASLFWLCALSMVVFRDTKSLELVTIIVCAAAIVGLISWRQFIPTTVEGQENRHM